MRTHAIIINTVLIALCSLFFFSFSLPTFAHDGGSKATSTAAKIKGKKTTDLSCMQTAVETREVAIATAFTSFHDDIEDALSARKAGLIEAWKTGDSASIKSTWATWKKDKKTAHSELKKARDAAWKTFRTTAKTTCKSNPNAGDVTGAEEKGSIAI